MSTISRRLQKELREERKKSLGRVQVRPSEYRGRAGYLISAPVERGFPVRIFVEREENAELVREALKRGDQDAISRIIRSEEKSGS